MDIDKITRQISGKCVLRVEAGENEGLSIQFVDGSALLIERLGQGLSVSFESRVDSKKCPAALWPTSRQRDYLEFIKKYMLRFGVSPAEYDIQRHFSCLRPR